MSEMVPSRDKVLALLKTFMERQKSEYSLISLGVFGSFARGEVQSDSDVDIMFDTDAPNSFMTAMMKQDLGIVGMPGGCVAVARIDRHPAEGAHRKGGGVCMTQIDRMDAICLILIAAGEEFKNIDRKTEGNLLSRYPTSALRLRSAQVRSGRRPASFVHRSK